MGKFAKSIRDKAKEPTITLTPATFIPLDQLDTWRQDIVSGKLSIDNQFQLYLNVGIHSYVVNRLAEEMQRAGADTDQIMNMLRKLYKEAIQPVNDSVWREMGAKPTYRN